MASTLSLCGQFYLQSHNSRSISGHESTSDEWLISCLPRKLNEEPMQRYIEGAKLVFAPRLASRSLTCHHLQLHTTI